MKPKKPKKRTTLFKYQIAANKKARREKSKKFIKKQKTLSYKRALAKWSLDVRTRDNHTCQLCTKNCKELGIVANAHHILDKRNWKEFSLDPKNGITLCYRCHKCNGFGPHMNALYFAGWLKKHKPEVYTYLFINMLDSNKFV